MTTKVTSSDGTTIAFDRSGDGPAVVLVSGALGNRMSNAQLAALLAPHFTVFNYDRRGRGDSGDTAPYAVEREIEDLEAVVNETGGSAFVFGTSSGGNLALEAAVHGVAITKSRCGSQISSWTTVGLHCPTTTWTGSLSSCRRGAGAPRSSSS